MSSNNIIVPLITPLDKVGDVCEFSVQKLLQQCGKYSYGVIPCLSSGEGWCLSEKQWTDMVRFCIQNSSNQYVIAGIERPTTDEVIYYINIAKSLYVDGVMVTTPFGEHISQDEMLDHYTEISKNCDCDLWVYHEMSLSQNILSLKNLVSISKLNNVVGIKDSGDDAVIMDNVYLFNQNGVSVYHGMEDKLVSGDGYSGNIVSLSNLYPEICKEACSIGAGKELQDKINIICEDYLLTDEDWYKHIKIELFNRNVILTDNIVGKLI